MSRVGSTPISIPDGVDVSVSGAHVTVTGSKGTLGHDVPDPITVRHEGQEIIVERPDDSRTARSLHGLTRSLINNMVIGVSQGFRKDLEIVGVGYRANAKGPSSLELALGFSHPVVIDAPEGITFDVPQPTRIGVIGIDKQVVGQVAANIRAVRKPEPYKGKGVRYLDERVIRKAGKAAK